MPRATIVAPEVNEGGSSLAKRARMGLENLSWRSTALIRQTIKISGRERPTNTSRSFGRRKFPRAEVLLRAKSVIRNPFVLSWQPEPLSCISQELWNAGIKFKVFLLSLAITFRFFGSVQIPKCFFVPSGFSVSHVSLLIATPQKSRSSGLSDDPRGAQNSIGNESPAGSHPCVIGQISLGALSLAL
jgi:hypothetical protein